MARFAARWKRRVVVPAGALLLACGLSGCLGWFVQFSNANTALTGIACPTATTCIAVGTSSIERTIDAGGSWTDVGGAGDPSLDAVSCPSATQCIAVGDGGSVLTSSDTGASWSQTTVPDFPSGAALTSVACADTSHCWASEGATGQFESTLQDPNVIEASSDGGTTWTAETWPIPAYNGSYTGQVGGVDSVSVSLDCPSASICVGAARVSYVIYPPPEATIPMLTSAIGVLVFTDDGGAHW